MGSPAGLSSVSAKAATARTETPVCRREPVPGAPLAPLVALICVVGCVIFFFSLRTSTQMWFLIWNVAGLVIYFAWASRNSRLARSGA